MLNGTDASLKTSVLYLLAWRKPVALYRDRFGKYFIRALTDSNHNIQKTAIRHIGKLGNDIAIPALEAAAEQEPSGRTRSLMRVEIIRLKTASPNR